MAGLITPAAALDGREAYAFLVSTYEKTADQCNYAADVRASMAQIDSQFTKADKDTWTGLKLRGRTALTDLETILPLNVDWSSCTSVGELLTTWASIAAVTSIMEMDQTPIDLGMGDTHDSDNDDLANQIAAMINEETARGKALAKANTPWTITPLASEVQGGCLLTIPLDADADFIAVSRPGDLMQTGLRTNDPTLLKPEHVGLAIWVDNKQMRLQPPVTDHSHVVWFDRADSDMGFAAIFVSARRMEITLNSRTFNLMFDGLTDAGNQLMRCGRTTFGTAALEGTP